MRCLGVCRSARARSNKCAVLRTVAATASTLVALAMLPAIASAQSRTAQGDSESLIQARAIAVQLTRPFMAADAARHTPSAGQKADRLWNGVLIPGRGACGSRRRRISRISGAVSRDQRLKSHWPARRDDHRLVVTSVNCRQMAADEWRVPIASTLFVAGMPTTLISVYPSEADGCCLSSEWTIV